MATTCPAGQIFNPITYRCVKERGRIGKRLHKYEDPDVELPILTRTLRPAGNLFGRITRGLGLDLDLDRGRETRGTRAFDPRRTTVANRDEPSFLNRITRRFRLSGGLDERPQLLPRRQGCPPGYFRNPQTNKCIKNGGRTQRRIERHATNTDMNEDLDETPILRYRDDRSSHREYRPSHREYRPSHREDRPSHRDGRASHIPLGDRESMREWIASKCDNVEEPFTGKNLRGLTEEEMTSVMRTSAGTCLRADYLDEYVRRLRSSGRQVVDPLQRDKELKLSNMDILGRVVRRVIPNYRVPQKTRKQKAAEQPVAERPATRRPTVAERPATRRPTVAERPATRKVSKLGLPDSWTFFIGKDARSGDDFYSVYYYDKDQQVMQENGVHIPADAIKIDIGVFPAYVGPTESGDKECTTNTMIAMLFKLNRKNRLIHKLGTELVPIIELPRNRAQWKTPDRAIQRKFFKQVCTYLHEVNAD